MKENSAKKSIQSIHNSNFANNISKEIQIKENKEKDKNYLNEIQKEIDSLEKQLFANTGKKEKPFSYQKKNLLINKDLSQPMETTLSNINDDSTITQQTIFNNDNSINAFNNTKKELYQIILRERKDNYELEKIRMDQQEKCKELEYNNLQLKQNIEMLEKEKREQALKIMSLQKEIDELRQGKINRISGLKNDLKEKINEMNKNF